MKKIITMVLLLFSDLHYPQKVTDDLDTVLTFMDSLPDNKYLTMNWIQRIFLHSYVSLVDKGPRSYKIG